MQHPTEDGSEHEQHARPPSAGSYTTHIEVFYLEKSTYVHLFDVLIKVGIKGVFGGYFLRFLGYFAKKQGG